MSVYRAPTDNIFVPIQEDNILPQIPIGTYHPVPRKGVEDSDLRTLNTNKFYANAFLGEQNQPIWTHPYYLWWQKGKNVVDMGGLATWGMCVGHSELGDVIYGPGDPAQYFTNPRKQSIILGARELDAKTILTTDTHLPFSVNINLKRGTAHDSPKLTFPVVQGMSFVTAGYRNASPMIQTGGKEGFKDISSPFMIGRSIKYRIKDSDARDWLLYVNPAAGAPYDGTVLTHIDRNTLILPGRFRGTIQIAKNPLGAETEALYDQAHGTFVAEAQLFATVTEAKGTYTFNYTKIGPSPLLMFALPHHIQSLDPDLKPGITKLQLQTTTKGMATAVWGDYLTYIEHALPISMSFGPWIPNTSSTTTKQRYPHDFLTLLAPIAEHDLRRCMSENTPQDSMYYAGKHFSKFATLLYIMHDVLQNSTLANTGLAALKTSFSVYVRNQQKYPLYYDDAWKGVVSNAGFSLGSGADFGNTWYNDHHFHYGYFVYAAAVLAYLDPGWLGEDDNKQWVNMLVKDYAESEYTGRDYPFQRAFDWWCGHSWAKGLFESADGKDQESTSEDGFSAFAIKMWGKVTGDTNMEKRGNLMLALQARSFNTYFYFTTNNTIQPTRYIGHKVAGITFENKLDYTTYFSTTPTSIHTIHMLPLNPASTYLRPRAWVQQEWATHFQAEYQFHTPSQSHSNPNPQTPSHSHSQPQPPSYAQTHAQTHPANPGQRGIIMSNLALMDAKTSFAFFRDGVDGFEERDGREKEREGRWVWDERWIDGGGSRSWYLVFAAGLGGVVR
ncbi:endo-1,3(4)-beta-glucanase 1 precursor [Massarina eburnea CBS 473.64]|uniref:glucan endo-1,3-beta-D-glucosidase n=1 Tax=Massarina eburnea CBS 473.64 TaxID=1395130 RepID=A0A6A6S6R9_9PLEO|nr:endo-1,3(4)-beta-glucanase 1 precursor [Massarina eburnea CBS 473.64]